MLIPKLLRAHPGMRGKSVRFWFLTELWSRNRHGATLIVVGRCDAEHSVRLGQPVIQPTTEPNRRRRHPRCRRKRYSLIQNISHSHTNDGVLRRRFLDCAFPWRAASFHWIIILGRGFGARIRRSCLDPVCGGGWRWCGMRFFTSLSWRISKI